ncbi:MAG: beta-ketoacyl-ACP synthase III [Flavobacteriales bacterium]|nr:beta-ketoacyl-ACP synthase III [Flavobacteriales bacterium]
MKDVYITSIAKFLPNEPVSNDEMESHLGMIGGKPSRARRIVLRNNGIRSRYYSLLQDGSLTHSNAQMVLEAIGNLGVQKNEIELLSCGTSATDQTLPSHTAMVHGLLDSPMEIISPSGACCSGIHAMKFGFLSIKAGETSNAVTAGSELISPMMMARNFESESSNGAELENNPFIGFEKDFLRWMLSDGAGAALLQDRPNESGISLKIDWIETRSYANEFETCMYSASDKREDGSIKSWKEFEPTQWLDHSVFAMKQDVKLLSSTIVPLGGKYLTEIAKRRKLDVSSIDYFLPHLSSNFFRKQVYNQLKSDGMEITEDKWFTNLVDVGNVGSASIYIMLEELFNSGKLKKGQKLLLMVPESARFSYAYALMTVC